MAIFASLFAFAGRFLGRLLNMAMGWATIMLFGAAPQSKQLLLSGITLGSLLWVASLLGVVFPSVGSFLISFAPIPASLAHAVFLGIAIENWIRIAMLIAAIVIPLLIGVGGYTMLEAADRPTGTGLVKQILRGYPYAAVLAVTIAFLIVVAPLRKVRSISKGWTDAHIPVVVKPGGYDQVANDLERALDSAGLDIERARAPRALEAPSKLLGKVAGAGIKRLVPDVLIELRNRQLEVLIYPSDIAISGKEDQLAHARAAIATRLTFTAAYLTTSSEAQAIEDRLERIWLRFPAVKSIALASSPANAGKNGPSGRAAAATAFDRDQASGRARAEAREAKAVATRTTVAANIPRSADGSGGPSGPHGTGVPVLEAEDGTIKSREQVVVEAGLPPNATRSEILAAGYPAPDNAPERSDGLDEGAIDRAVEELRDIDRELASLVVPHDEWEVLYRIRLQVERDLLVTRDVLEGRVDGHDRMPAAGLEEVVLRAVGAAAATVERVLAGSRLSSVAGVVRRVLPEPWADGDGQAGGVTPDRDGASHRPEPKEAVAGRNR